MDILPTNPTFNHSFSPDKNVAELPFLGAGGPSANRSTHRTGRIGVSGSGGILSSFDSSRSLFEINGKDSDEDGTAETPLPEGVNVFEGPPFLLDPAFALTLWVGSEGGSEPFPEPHIQLVITVVACATWFDNHTKMVVVTIMFDILHLVQGMTISNPFVSAAIQRWYWMMNVSSEHLPMNPNIREEADRRVAFAFLRMTNDMIGIHEMYGCQWL